MAVGVLGAGAGAALAVALVLVGAGETRAVPLRGEEELAAQTGAQLRTASLPRAAGRADTRGGLHDAYMVVACPRARPPPPPAPLSDPGAPPAAPVPAEAVSERLAARGLRRRCVHQEAPAPAFT